MAQSSAELALSSGVPMPPVPASSLGGGGIDGLLSQMQGERGTMQAQSAKTQELLKKPIGKLDDIGEEDKKLTPPELTTLPQAPPPVHSDPLQTFGSPASWLAVFGGLLTRNHLTNSLNAAASVMNARNQGDETQSKYNMDLWKANTENAIKMHEFEMDKYKESIQKLGTERQDALAEIQAISASTKNDTMYMLAANKDAEGVLKYFESLNSQMGKMQKSLENTSLIEQGVDLFKQTNPAATPKQLYDERVRLTRDVNSAEKGTADKSSAGLTDEVYNQKFKNDPQIKQLAEAYATGATIQQLAPGWSKDNPKRDAVQRMAYELHPDLNWADAHARYLGQQSEQRSVGSQVGKIDLASNMLDKSLPSMMQQAEKVGLSPSTDLNSAYNEIKRRASDNDFSNFSTQLRAVTSDYAQFIGRGRMTVHSDEEALRILNDDMGISSLQGFVDAVNTERSNVQSAIDETRGGKSSPKATHKWNPDKGELEEVK